MILILALIYLVIYYRSRGGENEFVYKDRLAQITRVTIYLFYPSILIATFQLFDCVKLDDGYYLEENLNISCDIAEYHDLYVPVGYVMLIFWGLILPVIVFMRIRSQLESAKKEEAYKVRCKYGFLLGGYKKKYYYWEFMRQIKKFFLILIVSELVRYGADTACVFMIMLIYAFIHFNYTLNTFKSKVVMELENYSLFSSILIILLGIMYND